MEFVDQFEREKPDDDVSRKRAAEVTRLASVLAERGTLPLDGPWLAGHQYNNALLRVDVCYEQAVSYYLLNNRLPRNMSDALIAAFRLGFPPDFIVPFWSNVRRQVNSLKHKSVIKTEGPAMPPAELLTVIERLVVTVEWLFDKGPCEKEPPSIRY